MTKPIPPSISASWPLPDISTTYPADGNGAPARGDPWEVVPKP